MSRMLKFVPFLSKISFGNKMTNNYQNCHAIVLYETLRKIYMYHAAFLDISKIEPGQIPQKFHNMDDQSTFLNILEEKLGAITRNLWS